MPTLIHTLARQCAPKTGPISEAEMNHILGQSWPQPKSCNQNCNQGRMCDCVADVDERDPMTDGDRMWITAMFIVSALSMFGLLWWLLPIIKGAM